MNIKIKRIIAILGLAFMAVFSVTFVMFLFNPQMGGGVVAFLALFSGIAGIVSFFIIKLIGRAEAETAELKADEEGEPEDEVAEEIIEEKPETDNDNS